MHIFGIVHWYNVDWKKGGNNVAFLIYSKFKFDEFVEKIDELGLMKEYSLIMDTHADSLVLKLLPVTVESKKLAVISSFRDFLPAIVHTHYFFRQ